MKNQIQKINKKDSQLVNLESQLDLLLKGQEKNSDKLQIIGEELRLGFIELALRNQELVELNKELTQQLGSVVAELNEIKQECQEKEIRKQARGNRKRLLKSDPINPEIYNLLIKEIEGPSYTSTRTRVAICLLTITGIRITELLLLEVGQLETLLADGWISIDRVKRGPASHKAFLTREGKKLLKARKKDFQFLFLMKDKNSCVFTSDRKPDQMLRRETLMTYVNKAMHSVSKKIPSQPNITRHSFRVGYITHLWKDTRDIEFVRQTIGHMVWST